MPPPEAVNVLEVPEHIEFVPEIEGVGKALIVTVLEAEAVQPLCVTVTV